MSQFVGSTALKIACPLWRKTCKWARKWRAERSKFFCLKKSSRTINGIWNIKPIPLNDPEILKNPTKEEKWPEMAKSEFTKRGE